MKSVGFKKGQAVVVTTKRGQIEGVVSSVDTNLCTFGTEYSVDYFKDGKLWTMICIHESALKLK